MLDPDPKPQKMGKLINQLKINNLCQMTFQATVAAAVAVLVCLVCWCERQDLRSFVVENQTECSLRLEEILQWNW